MRLAAWEVDAAASITARLAWPEVSSVAVGAVHFFARDMLGGVHTCRAASIAFGLLLGHHMAAHRAEPQIFSFSHVRMFLRRSPTLSGIGHFCSSSDHRLDIDAS